MSELYSVRRFTARACLVLGSFLVPVAGAQAQASLATQHHATIEKDYPKMLAAFNAGQYDVARKYCQQAMTWEPGEFSHAYNLGCVEAKAGRSDAAFTALNKALALGYSDAAALEADKDMSSLHKDPRWETLVTQVKAYKTSLSAPLPPIVQPAEPVSTNGQLQGLYMTTLTDLSAKPGQQEKYATWYFAPDGKVYYNPERGFAPEELGTTPEMYGSYSLSGSDLTVTWPSQEASTAALQAIGDGFTWNGTLFTPARPFASAQKLTGNKFKFTRAVTEGADAVVKGFTIKFNADGTYTTEAINVPAQVAGHWKLQGYYLTLADASNQVSHCVCFPIDYETTAAYPDQLYFTGGLYTNVATLPAASKAPVKAQAAPARKK